jgi:hypothetical protein
MADLLFLTQFASTLIMVGVIWFVQVIHYPLYDRVGRDGFARYERSHQNLTGWVVIPPMLLELLTTLAMLWSHPAGVEAWVAYLGLALLAVVWASTFLLQVPAHRRLADRFESAAYRRLVRTNWVRTVAWTLRGALLFWVMSSSIVP